MTGPRRAGLSAVAAIAALAVLWLVVDMIGARPGYDSSWHVVWAQQMLDGRAPSLDAWAAPTEHPLMLLIALVAAPFDGDAGEVLVALDLLALLLVALPAMRLMSSALGSGAAGLVGWAIVAGAYGLLLAALRGYLDVWFVLLVTWAGARIAGQRRAGAGALQLGLAGLLRPEAWALAAVAAVASRAEGDGRGVRANVVAALLPPLAWFGFDGLVTGKPFLSLETARTLAVEGDGGGTFHVVASSLFGGVRGPATLLGLVGLALALRFRGRKAAAVPAVLGAAGLAIAAAISLAGLTLLPRYLMLAWLSLSLFGGFAIAGWTGATGSIGDAARTRWRILGIAAACIGAVGAVVLGAPAKLASEVAIDRGMGNDLATLLSEPTVREGLRCGPLTFPSFRLVPDAMIELGQGEGEVRARAAGPRPQTGVAIVVTGTDKEVVGRYSRPGIDLPVDEEVPPGFMPAGTSGDLSAFVRCSLLSR